MASIFGGGSAPAPQAVPISPMVDPKAEEQRADKAAAAAAASAAAGRASTIRAGASMALDDQMQRGLLSRRRRDNVANELLG